jgi:[protein-PII] uridylyltransferase
VPVVDADATWRLGTGPARRAAHAAAIRDWLSQQWEDATQGLDASRTALAWVGSHARAEGGPCSDLDLVLVHDRGHQAPGLADLSDRLWYPLWDTGIRFDHAVRTVAECRSVASTDLAAAVGLLDLAFIAGDEAVVRAAREATAHDWRKTARGRLADVVETVEARHQRFGDAAHMLAPDLKEARGGLRDMVVLRSLTAAWLADRPHGDVDTAYQRLLDVRDAIHHVTGRHRERLDRELAGPVAEVLGLDDPDAVLVEVYRAARQVAHALDLTVRRARQSQAARRLRIGPRRPQLRPLGHGTFEHDGEIVLGAGAAEAEPLVTSLRAATEAARAARPLAPATLGHLAAALRSAPGPAQWDAPAREALGELLAAGPALIPTWEALDLAGVVDHWLPEWHLVRCRPQHSPVHRHTVDRHNLETVVRAAELVRRVTRPDLLLIAALLHDLGKGTATIEHPAEGARLATAVLDRWGMPSADAALVLTVVREHLTLAELATRRDPSDPATVDALMTAIGYDLETLELLHALTVADAAAVGGHAWNAWRARLIDDLVAATRRQLTGAPPPSEPAVVIPAELAELAGAGVRCVVTWETSSCRVSVAAPDRQGLFADVAGLLAVAGHGVRSAALRTADGRAVQEWHVEADGGSMPDAAALVRRLARITEGDRTLLARLDRSRDVSPAPSGVGHTGMPLSRHVSLPAVVEIVPDASRVATVVRVRGTDRRGLLHDIGRAVAGCGLGIRSAHVETYAGQTLDTFYVTTLEGRPLNPTQTDQVLAALRRAADPA